MISKSIDQNRITCVRHQGQGIPCLKIVLAYGGVRNLPGWNRIAAERIIHPFRNFVAHGRNIRQSGTKNSLFHPACPNKGLNKFDLRHLSRIE
jgi:hypothetical protein